MSLITNKNDQAEGFHVGSQTPLDDRRYYSNLADLVAAIAAGTEPYRFYEGIVIWIKDTAKSYRWQEAAIGIAGSSFTYPAGISAGGNVYGGRTFWLVEQSSVNTTDLYSIDDTVGTTRKAIITDTLTWLYPDLKAFVTWDVATDKITWHATTVNIDKLGNTTTDKVLGIKDNGDVIHHVAHRITLDFEAVVQYAYRAPSDFKVVTYDNPDALTVTLKVNGVAYTLGDPITQFTDTLTIDVSAIGLINLNCEYIF
jgi:hypothetical protein